MKSKTTTMILVVFMAAASVTAQTDGTTEDRSRFYNTDPEFLELKNEVQQLKQDILKYQSEVNISRIRHEIEDIVSMPELTHRITLKNGTVVTGAVLEENLDQLKVRTSIGEITLNRNHISHIEELKGGVELGFEGSVKELNFSDKKVYTGTVVNSGTRKADFVRVVFTLFDENAEQVATDSAFVLGQHESHQAGIVSYSSLRPGKSGQFQCTVETDGAGISYYTTEIISCP